MALDRQDYTQAATQLEALQTLLAHDATLAGDFITPPSCYLALAEEYAGNPAKADAALAQGGRFVDCYRFKGDIAAHRGNWAQAQKNYAAAVALAPSLPQVYESWGEALFRHGAYQDAIVQFAAAHQRGPHWCDPLEHWGEALAAQGNYRGAIEKYAAAAQYTPGWGALELHWGLALDKLGKHSDALAHYQAAQAHSESLIAADRATLAKRLASVSAA
jgi:tetratricopeptide (TPR) repeat protein